MATLLQDIRFATRSLRKNLGFTLVATLTLALGIGANTAIFSVVQNVLLRELPYAHAETLVQIKNAYMPVVDGIGLSTGDFGDWRQQAHSISDMGAYIDISQGFNLTGEGEPERVLGTNASAGLFSMLGVRPVVGRAFVPEEDKPGSAAVVMLSHSFWTSHFGGDPAIVGRTLNLDNQRYTVIGVLPASFGLLHWPDVWMPVGQYSDDDSTGRVHHPYTAIARLKPGVTLAQAQAEFATLNHQAAIAFPDTHKNWTVHVAALEDPSAAKLRRTLLVLFGAVGLVLLIACANIVNLLLARNSVREKEFALRTALGASRWRLVRQVLTESMLLSLAGGAVGLLFAAIGLKILRALVPADLAVATDTGLNASVLAFTASVCVAAGVASGLLPALQSLRTNLNDVLKQGTKGTGAFGSRKVHNLLVVSEIAMALIPLIGAGLLLRSFHNLLAVDPGFRSDHILTLQMSLAAIPAAQAAQMTDAQSIALGKKQSLEFEQIADRVRALPGVKAAGGIDDLPLGTELTRASRFVIEGRPLPDAGIRPVAQTRTASIGYFSAIGIPLLKGREFNQADWSLQNVVINETMARRFWPDDDPLGKRVNVCSMFPTPCWFPIVGVVGDVHQYALDAAPTSDMYFTGGWTPYLVIRTASDPASLAAAATDIIHKIDPALPVMQVLTMDELLADSVSPRRFSAVLTGIFAGLALLLAAVGIYGVMSYTVSQRIREIGIRMALGAQPRNVRGLILGRTLELAIIGVAFGLTGAAVLTRFLASMLFGVKAYDPLTFAAVAVVLTLVALAASYLPARRAMRVDPTVALRYE
jgi:putative ABC transport system permease protein